MVEEVDRVWVDSMPEAYERFLSPAVFGPFAVELAQRVSSRGARRVLELAAGTGVVTRELVSVVSGEVLATDLNASMVECGLRRVPQATWRQADAMDLPFGSGEFDVVVCQFGVMFFPDKRVAFAETKRVLEPGGRFVFNTWADLESHEFQVSLVAALSRVFPEDPPAFMAAVPHGYADPQLVAKDARAAGFREVIVDTITLEGHAGSVADLAAGYCAGTPLRTAIEARADLTDATALIAREMEADLGLGPVTGRMTAHVVEATID